MSEINLTYILSVTFKPIYQIKKTLIVILRLAIVVDTCSRLLLRSKPLHVQLFNVTPAI